MKCNSMSDTVFYSLYSKSDEKIIGEEYEIGSNTTLNNTKKWHEGLNALAKVVILLWRCKYQEHFRAFHKVFAFYCHSCDYRIREIGYLKEYNSSLMMQEILAFVVVTIQQDKMAWITMSKPNLINKMLWQPLSESKKLKMLELNG